MSSNQLKALQKIAENGYDPVDNMHKVKSVQKKFRDSFGGVALDPLKWDSVVAPGGTLSVAAGILTIGSGIVPDEVTYLLSKEIFTVPFKLSFNLGLSQRIANQTFLVELVSVDPITLVPDGKNSAAILFDDVTATRMKYRVQSDSLAPLDSALATVSTTAGAVSTYEIEPFADECWFHTGTMDSAVARAYSFRRHQQIPDPNALYKIRLKWLNGSVAPASNTDATLQYISCYDYAELTAEITAGRGNGVAGQGIFATIAGTVTATGVAGAAAHDAAVSGSPVRTGGKAVTAAPPVSATGDTADYITTMTGAQVIKPFTIPELEWSFACTAAIANTTDVVLKTAGAAGIRNYLTGLWVKNINAVATEFVIKDDTTVIFRGHLAASMVNGELIQFSNPLKGTAAKALNFACITTAAAVYVDAQGYQAP